MPCTFALEVQVYLLCAVWISPATATEVEPELHDSTVRERVLFFSFCGFNFILGQRKKGQTILAILWNLGHR